MSWKTLFLMFVAADALVGYPRPAHPVCTSAVDSLARIACFVIVFIGTVKFACEGPWHDPKDKP